MSMNRSMVKAQEQTVLGRQPLLAPRCRMEIVQGSGLELTDEIHQLLRRRLRLACTISLVVFATFFLRGIGQLTQVQRGLEPFDRALQGGVVAVLVILCTLLWTNYALNHLGLRLMELVMFATMAAFFVDLQLRVNYPDRLEQWARPTEEALARVLALGNSANNTRWFFLIVLYGMFIPNTWKRCAMVVGCMALTPIILTFVNYAKYPIVQPVTASLLFDTLIVMSFSSAMAIFGSYRISELQQQAYQARKLGQYQLHRKLGSGGMGEVYLGEHVLLRRACAIKLIRADQAGDPTTLSRFEREVQAMATLTHWNTVEIYDYGRTEDGTLYYVMEYLPGLSLQELVDEHGPLPAGRIIHFLRQICTALQEAHAIGLIHRDIKPSNIIICRRGNVYDVAKLLDFGLVQEVTPFAGASDKLTLQGAVLGSPHFLSPEQASGKHDVDARTDIYSVGALAFFLATGQTPFVRETVMELLFAHMKDEVVSLRKLRPDIPADLEEVILTCMRKNPDDRFADAESLERALAACEAADQWSLDQARNWWRQGGQRTEVSAAT